MVYGARRGYPRWGQLKKDKMIDTIWTILIGAYQEIRELVLKKKEISRTKKDELLEKFIEPSFSRLESIHDDYVKSFSILYENINSKDKIEETIELFKKSRIHLLRDRITVRSLAQNLQEVDLEEFYDDEIIEAFIEYGKAVDNYFIAAGNTSNVSWYSAFLAEFEGEYKKGQNPFEKSEYRTIGGGQNCLPKIKDKVFQTINRELPEAWKIVSDKYNRLKLNMI